MLLVHPLDFLEESEQAFRGGPVVTEAFHFGDEFQLPGAPMYDCQTNSQPLGWDDLAQPDSGQFRSAPRTGDARPAIVRSIPPTTTAMGNLCWTCDGVSSSRRLAARLRLGRSRRARSSLRCR